MLIRLPATLSGGLDQGDHSRGRSETLASALELQVVNIFTGDRGAKGKKDIIMCNTILSNEGGGHCFANHKTYFGIPKKSGKRPLQYLHYKGILTSGDIIVTFGRTIRTVRVKTMLVGCKKRDRGGGNGNIFNRVGGGGCQRGG